MCEERSYKYRISAMLSHLQHFIRQGDLSQNGIVSNVDLCYLDHLYTSVWFRLFLSRWRADLHFEHRHRKRTPVACLLGGTMLNCTAFVRLAVRDSMFLPFWRFGPACLQNLYYWSCLLQPSPNTMNLP